MEANPNTKAMGNPKIKKPTNPPNKMELIISHAPPSDKQLFQRS